MGRIENTLEFDFGNTFPRIAMISIHRWFKSMGINEKVCSGIMAIIGVPTQVVRVKFQTRALMECFLEKQKEVFELKEGNKIISVKVKEAGLREKFVRIADVPFEVDTSTVKKVLENFGKVITIKRDMFGRPQEAEQELIPVPSGWMTVSMVLDRDIPSYLMIEDFRAIIRYQGQPKTCRICNHQDHLAFQCPRNNRPRYTNTIPGASWGPSTTTGRGSTQQVVNDKDFPPLHSKRLEPQKRKQEEQEVIDQTPHGQEEEEVIIQEGAEEPNQLVASHGVATIAPEELDKLKSDEIVVPNLHSSVSADIERVENVVMAPLTDEVNDSVSFHESLMEAENDLSDSSQSTDTLADLVLSTRLKKKRDITAVTTRSVKSRKKQII